MGGMTRSLYALSTETTVSYYHYYYSARCCNSGGRALDRRTRMHNFRILLEAEKYLCMHYQSLEKATETPRAEKKAKSCKAPPRMKGHQRGYQG